MNTINCTLPHTWPSPAQKVHKIQGPSAHRPPSDNIYRNIIFHLDQQNKKTQIHQSFQSTCTATTRTAAKQCANISITNQVQRGSRQAKQSKHPWKHFWMLPLLDSSLPGYLLWKLLPAQTYLPPFCLQRSSLSQHESMVLICFRNKGRIIH